MVDRHIVFLVILLEETSLLWFLFSRQVFFYLYSDVVSDVLAIVKKVCVTCPCCEARLRRLPAKLEEVEKKLDEFVARVEEKFSDLKGSSLPAQRICSPDIDVDKAVKDAVSAINNRDHVILYGLPETGSAIKDFDTVKDIFDSLGVNDVKAMDVSRISARKSSLPKNIRSLLLKKNYWYPKNKLIYRQYAKQYDEAVKSYYSLRELDIAKSKNISRFYAYANSKLNSSVGIPPLLSDDGTLAIEDCDKCELLNKYFVSVFTKDNGKHQHFPLRIQSTKSLNIISFTYDKVLRSLRNLPNKCSKTPDGFPAFF
ncbi:hypothetical protein EMCRGX_G007985 [Ephydatia muelleri]